MNHWSTWRHERGKNRRYTLQLCSYSGDKRCSVYSYMPLLIEHFASVPYIAFKQAHEYIAKIILTHFFTFTHHCSASSSMSQYFSVLRALLDKMYWPTTATDQWWLLLCTCCARAQNHCMLIVCACRCLLLYASDWSAALVGMLNRSVSARYCTLA